MMKAFSYQSAKTVEQAVGALSDRLGQVQILAGGTDLLALMKDGLAAPETLVDIKQISDLGGIRVGDGGITIGATATLAEIADHSAIGKNLPALAEAARVIGGPQIRNMGTLGGNLCQKNRDWYFRNGLDPAVRDENQYSAIFPKRGAVYLSPSTLAPPLIAYGASVLITGPNGNRSIEVEDFFQVDKQSGRENVLEPKELLTGVTIPVSKRIKSADYQVRERESHDWPLVQASVALAIKGDSINRVRVVLGHVAPLPLRAKATEQLLKGQVLTEELAGKAGKAATEGAQPLGKNGYKVSLTQVAVKRALLSAVGNEYWRS